MLDALAQGFEEAFKGRPYSGLPTELVAALKRTKLSKTLSFRLRFGEAAAIDEALDKIVDERCDLNARETGRGIRGGRSAEGDCCSRSAMASATPCAAWAGASAPT
jgi:hypothetical protein